jgi:phosphohistidine swiveling domain-containing protein
MKITSFFYYKKTSRDFEGNKCHEKCCSSLWWGQKTKIRARMLCRAKFSVYISIFFTFSPLSMLRASVDLFGYGGEDSIERKEDDVAHRLLHYVEPSLVKKEVLERLREKLERGQEKEEEEGGKKREEEEEEEWCLGPLHPLATSAQHTGGKGSSLAILNAVFGCHVPDFFCVSTSAFKCCVTSSPSILFLMNQLQSLSDKWISLQEATPSSSPSSDSSKSVSPSLSLSLEIAEVTAKLRTELTKAQVSDDVISSIRKSYAEMCKRATGEGGKEGELLSCAVRSSATTEDTAEASFAGQHDTFLHQRGQDDVIHSVRKCWASIFTDRAVEYRNRQRIPHSDAVMCVVVQRMVSPYVAGTSFSVELSTSFPAIHICASYGLGEAVVSGSVTGDEWLIQKSDRLLVLKEVCGSKRQEYVPIEGASGVHVRDVEEERRQRLCLPREVIQQIARVTLNIAKAYHQLFGYEDVDTEFAVARSCGDGDVIGEYRIHMLQSRPVVVLKDFTVTTVDKEDSKRADVLVKGQYSLLGAVTGKLKVILDFDDLVTGREQIQADDILVTTKTSNYFNPYLTNLRGICTFEGSATAHPMLIGRERHLPVVCGVPNASMELLKRLYQWNGVKVTLDGLTRSLYAGELRTKALTKEELENQFSLVTVELPPDDRDTLEFLQLYHRLHIDPSDGSNWVYNPNAYLSPAWCQLRLLSYGERFELVNGSRTVPLHADPFSGTQAKIVSFPPAKANESHRLKVCDRVVPVRDTLSVFHGMGLEECWAFHRTCEVVAEEFMEACADFGQVATVEKWRRYIRTASRLYATTWLSYFFRLYVNEILTRHARDLQISQVHYDEMLKHLQLLTTGEDDHYQRSLRVCAIDMLPILQGRPLSQRPALLSQIETMALNFRVEKETDILRPLPLELVLHTVLEAAFHLSQNPAFSSPSESALRMSDCFDAKGKGSDAETVTSESVDSELESVANADQRITFFPTESSLRQWAELSVTARVHMSSCHHYKVRGQHLIKNELLRVARVCRLAVWTDLLKAETLDVIEEYIAKYELDPNKSVAAAMSSSVSFIQRDMERNVAMKEMDAPQNAPALPSQDREIVSVAVVSLLVGVVVCLVAQKCLNRG